MPDVKLWWQGADKPHHCRPDDAFYSVEMPAGDGTAFAVSARPGACAAVQLMALADHDTELAAIDIDLPWGLHVPALDGVDRFGNPFGQRLSLKAGQPWPIWMLLDVPMQAQGAYEAAVAVSFAGGETALLALTIAVSGTPDPHGGEDDMLSLSRLKWLDSTLGTEDTVTWPYLPIQVKGQRAKIVGREIALGDNGLPCQAFTHFTGINDVLLEEGEAIFSAPPALEAVINGAPVQMAARFETVSVTDARWSFKATCQGGPLTLTLSGWLEFDGWMRYEARWEASEQTEIDDIRLLFFVKPRFARWFTGVGTSVVERPERHAWRWDRDKHQDGCILCGMNGGVVLRPLAEDYVVPYCNIYYKFGPRNLPRSWVNGGEGSFALEKRGDHTEIGYHTGRITLPAGQSIRTDFEMAVTPFKQTYPAKHYATHYYQAPGPTQPEEWIETSKAIGATHVVVHHAKDIYPFINYPLYDAPAMQNFIARAHREGLKVKPYYTVRELTSKLPEFFPFRSLKDEIYAQPNFNFDGVPGQGEKDAWLKAECGDLCLPAWKHEFKTGKYAGQTDPAVIVNPASRIVNFYMEGLRYMCDNWAIDGIYVDDTGLDRYAFQRIRRVLDGRRPGAKIDLHSWSHFHDYWGESWGHNAVMYAELFPYLDSLWFGEGFDFNEITPNEMLVECSGLPFGLMSEMLQGGGNPWRGLLFGMTNRAGWSATGTEGIWAMREKYGFGNSRLSGWWEEEPLAVANRQDVLVSAYDLPDGVMVCAASFAAEDVAVRLSLNGAVAKRASLPFIRHIQEAGETAPDAEYTLAPGGGVVVWMEK